MSKVPYREHLRDVKYLAILHIILSLPFALESLEYIRHLSDTFRLYCSSSIFSYLTVSERALFF